MLCDCKCRSVALVVVGRWVTAEWPCAALWGRQVASCIWTKYLDRGGEQSATFPLVKFYAPQMRAIIFCLIETAYNQSDNQGDVHYLINSGEHSRGVMLSYCSFWLIPGTCCCSSLSHSCGPAQGLSEERRRGWEEERRGVGEEHTEQLTTVDGAKQLTLLPTLLSICQPSPVKRIALRWLAFEFLTIKTKPFQ